MRKYLVDSQRVLGTTRCSTAASAFMGSQVICARQDVLVSIQDSCFEKF